MKKFEYTITNEIGLHARPASLLFKLVKSLDSKVTLIKGEKSADATSIFALMGMAIKKGDNIEITAEGGDEEKSMETLEAFFKENL